MYFFTVLHNEVKEEMLVGLFFSELSLLGLQIASFLLQAHVIFSLCGPPWSIPMYNILFL